MGDAADVHTRYHQTLSYVQSTLEQQNLLLAQYKTDEASWVEERASLYRQLREVANAFNELRTASVADHEQLRQELDVARASSAQSVQARGEQGIVSEARLALAKQHAVPLP